MVGAAALPLRVAVALSGGVDSAVTALVLHRCVHSAADVAALRCFGTADAPPPPLPTLLAALEARQPLHRLLPTGVGAALVSFDTSRVSLYPFYMRNWHDVDAPHGWCVRSQRDYDDAQAVAHALQLLPSSAALPMLDLAAAYATRCFQHMLHAYAAGHTLNVDVLCNSRIKFGAAADALGVLQASTTTVGETKPISGQRTLLATGHYARTWCLPTTDSPHPALLLQPCSAGQDLNDQTHFLARVSPCRLAGALFPLGHLFTRKADVRAVAQHCFGSDSGVAHIAAKVTSTGICFVGPPRRAQTTNSDAAAAAASCNTRFAHFLNDFVPPPPPQPRTTLPACTVFRDAVTGAEKTLAAEDAAWRRLRDDYPTHLPAYAFTLGQRVRLCNADGGGAAVLHYVAAKTCLPATRGARSGEARLLAEVCVVDRWDDPLLFTATVPAVSLVFWLPTAALRRAAAAYGGADDRNEYAFRCLCAVRHQATPQPAVVRWCRSSEAALNGESSPSACRLYGLRVRSCTVCFDEPVRCPAAGQAVVLYASLAVVEDLVVSRGKPAQPPACAPTPLAVVGAAWVATAAAGDVSVDHLQSLH